MSTHNSYRPLIFPRKQIGGEAMVVMPTLWVIKWRPRDGEQDWHFYHERGRIWVDDDRESAEQRAEALRDDEGMDYIAAPFAEMRRSA